MKHLRVFKFGGASIRDAAHMRNVAHIIAHHATQSSLAVVVSALGKTTNALEEVIASHAQRNGRAFELLERIKQQHYALARELFGTQHPVFDLLNDRFAEAEWVLEDEPHPNYDYMYDQIICVGELASSTILAHLLIQEGLPTEWVDARDLIITDNIFREGWVQWDETHQLIQQRAKPLLAAGKILLTQGFIASTRDNETTTLGREGSDYTAAILAYCLDAHSMTIWKDVPGILTGDPRIFDNVTKLDEVSYREAIEMTYYGAKVIHPKTIKPLQNKSIPLYVKSFVDPQAPGTVISADAEDNYPPIVVLERNQALLHISTRDFSFVAEHHMSYLFNKIAAMRLQVNMMQNTAISFSICVNDIDDRVDRFAQSIQEQFKVKVDRGLELITVRYYQPELLKNLRQGKVVLLEERIRKTVQWVVKDVPVMKRKSQSA